MPEATRHPAYAWARGEAEGAAERVGPAMASGEREAFIDGLAKAILDGVDERKKWQREFTLDDLARDAGARRAGGRA